METNKTCSPYFALQSHLAEPLVFIYCPVVLLKMGWFENKPHLFTCNVVIKFLCQQFLATVDTATCEFELQAVTNPLMDAAFNGKLNSTYHGVCHGRH